MKRRIAPLAVLIISLVYGCTEFTEPESDRFEASLNPATWPDTLVLATSDTFSVSVLDAQGRTVVGARTIWSSPSTSVLAVTPDADGVSARVAASGLGSAELNVDFGGRPFASVRYTDTVHVVLGGVALVGGLDDSVSVGAILDTFVVHATGLDGTGAPVAGAGLGWTTRGEGVTVLQPFSGGDSARIIAIAEGSDVVVVEQPACRGTCADSVLFTVTPAVAQLTVTPSSSSVMVSDTVRLSAEGKDRNGSVVVGARVSWTSLDPARATVDSTGLVTAIDSGAVNVVAAVTSGAADTAQLTVLPTGVMALELADAPSTYLAQAWLFLADGWIAEAQGRRRLLDGPRAFDLLTLRDGLTGKLGAARIPAGAQSGVFLDVDSAVVELAPPWRFSDGSRRRSLPLPPSARDSLSVPFGNALSVAHRDTVTVVIDFDVDRNFPLDQIPGADSIVQGLAFEAIPRAVERARAATISGTVSGLGAGGVLIRAARVGTADTLTGLTRSDGTFDVVWAEPGDYEVAPTSLPGCFVPSPLSRAVTAPAGTIVGSVDFLLDSVAIGRIELGPVTDTLRSVGDGFFLAASALDGSDLPITGASISFTSSNAAAVTISPDGEVVARGNGTATVSASSCGVSSSFTVTVRQEPAEIRLTAPAGGGVTLEPSATFQLAVTVLDAGGTAIPGANVSWSSGAPSIATVGTSGLVSAVAPGVTEVTVSAGTVSILVPVSVLAPGLVVRPVAVGGQGFTCDVDTEGAAWCWGNNQSGQLGDGTFTRRTTPVRVGGGLTFASVTTGYTHACGLTATGEAWCWGAGYSGQLGYGANGLETLPVAVSGGYRFRDITAGEFFTCGLSDADRVLCWGDNGSGQLGIGSVGGSQNTPREAIGGRTYRSVDAGGANTCAIGTDGVTYCWGATVVPTASAPAGSPIAVSGALALDRLSVGARHACAIDGSSRAYCWGEPGDHLGGSQSRVPSSPVSGFQAWSSIEAGVFMTCGVTQTGVGYCWGGNWDGLLGTGSRVNSSTPQLIAGGHVLTKVSGGNQHVCARDQTGRTLCWGYRGDGGVGDGQTGYADLPQPVAAGPVTAVSSRFAHGCAIQASGQGVCWGGNWNGQIGDGTSIDRASPVPIALAAPLAQVSVATGGSHTCAVDTAGVGYCWGYNGFGQLGDSTFAQRTTPTRVAGSLRWREIHAGARHSCGLATDSLAYCWGANDQVQLGDGSSSQRTSPGPVAGGRRFVSLAVTEVAACGLTAAGQLFCWGTTFSLGRAGPGGVGDGTNLPRSTPVEVGAGIAFRTISAGGLGLFCAVATDDTGWCWVDGAGGRLGDGQFGTRWSPVPVAGGQSFTRIDAGWTHACGVTTTSLVLCWGENWQAQLGTGAVGGAYPTPQVGAGGLALTQVSAGERVSCGIDASGRLYCWGDHRDGRTGVGLTGRALIPTEVTGR